MFQSRKRVVLLNALTEVSSVSQEVYFKKHKFNTVPNVQLKNVDRCVDLPHTSPLSVKKHGDGLGFLVLRSLKRDGYEVQIQNLLK